MTWNVIEGVLRVAVFLILSFRLLQLAMSTRRITFYTNARIACTVHYDKKDLELQQVMSRVPIKQVVPPWASVRRQAAEFMNRRYCIFTLTDISNSSLAVASAVKKRQRY